MADMNTSVNDHSDKLTNPQIAKLIANGVLLSECKDFVLVINEHFNTGQQLIGVDAPVEIQAFATITWIDSTEQEVPIKRVSGEGAPAQAYHQLVSKFNKIVETYHGDQ